MNKAFIPFLWENEPSIKTPIDEDNLNSINNALDIVDSRVINLDSTKLDKTTANTMVQDVTFDISTGIFTIVKLNGSKLTIDTKLEKLAINWKFDKDKQQLIIVLDDGTEQTVDLSSLITQYEFKDSDTIILSVDSAGKVYGTIKKGSITGEYLEPNYLANVTEKADTATKKAAEAAASATAAKKSETNAANSATAASSSEKASAASQTASANSATNAATSATNAANSATAASSSASSANTSKTNAASSATAAASSASAAATSATQANNYANGSTNSAKYYYEQAKNISESFSGALRPIGTVTFANLPALSSVTAGDMYNISNEFTTTSDFKEGSGNVVPAGTNVYKTADGKWDILAGTPVTGIKGNAESSYRRGNVNITPANIGLGNVPNVSTNDQTPTFSQASSRTNISSGEKLSSIFGKIMKWFADLKTVAFSGSYNDLSNKPTIGNGTITIKQNGTSKGTFTMNQSGNTTIELTDNNTTYSTGTTSTPGLTKLYTSTGTNTDGAMTQSAIKTTVDSVEQKIDNIQVGGRNLLYKYMESGGNTTKIDELTVQINPNNADTYFFLKLASGITQGETYTLSCDVAGLSSGDSVAFYTFSSYYITCLRVEANGRTSYTFTAPKSVAAGGQLTIDDGARNVTSSFTLSNFKLERGNKATDYTIAPEDIEAQIDNKLPLSGGTMTGTIGVTALKSATAPTGTSKTDIIVIPQVAYATIDSTHTDSVYFKELIKWICANYSDKTSTMFIGSANPNSCSMFMCRIYSTDKVDSSGYPQYADCVTFNLGGSMYRFGFENYSWYWTYVNPNNTTYSAGTGISLSGTTFSNSGVRSITTGSTNGTISVNTNGTTTNVTVKGLAAGAYASTYAGSSSAGGSATSAVQLATARTIQTNLGSTSAASFNGTANVTPGITGTLSVAHGGTGATTAAAALKNLGLSVDATVLNNVQALFKATVDLSDTSKYSEDTWYPVISNSNFSSVGFQHVKVSVQLNSGTKPSWSTHSAGFTVNVDILATACDWGTTKGQTMVLQNDYKFADDHPVGYTQMSNSSKPVFYLRGGGKYFVWSSYYTTWIPQTSTYTALSQSVAPATTYPGISLYTTATVTANLNGTASYASALNTSAGSATQPVYFSGGKPVACTYTLGKSVPSNAVFTDTNTWRGIQNNLTSTSTTDSLSAYQGKVLNDKFASYVPTTRTVNGKALSANITLSASDVGAAASSHTHSYLPLTGGTASGDIKVTDGTYCTTLSYKSVSCSWSTGGWNISDSGISLPSGGITMAGNISMGGILTCTSLKVNATDGATVSGNTVLHKGNSAPVAIQESAPSDTSALWVY